MTHYRKCIIAYLIGPKCAKPTRIGPPHVRLLLFLAWLAISNFLYTASREMSNRNFDGRVIIQRLQNQNYARNLYDMNMKGQSLIHNPQNSDGAASRLATFSAGSQTQYFRGLIGAGDSVSLGGISDLI